MAVFVKLLEDSTWDELGKLIHRKLNGHAADIDHILTKAAAMKNEVDKEKLLHDINDLDNSIRKDLAEATKEKETVKIEDLKRHLSSLHDIRSKVNSHKFEVQVGHSVSGEHEEGGEHVGIDARRAKFYHIDNT